MIFRRSASLIRCSACLDRLLLLWAGTGAGAGLVSLDDAGTFGLYLLVPLTLLVIVSTIIHVTGKRLGIGRTED